MALKFKIIEKCWQDASGIPAGDADFLLEKDDWNDYFFHVMYHLHATNKWTKNGNQYLGSIRIMKKGQQERDVFILERDLGSKNFTEVPQDYVSLSSSIELYEGLSRLLTQDERLAFINQLHLILCEDSPFFVDSLRADVCFNAALLRDISFDSYVLLRGKFLMENAAIMYNLQEQKVLVKFANCDEPVNLKFSCLPDCESKLIPNGLIAFIGKNGSGKSTAIYNFAKLVYASPDQRFRLKDTAGVLEPNDLGISKLFIVSYSPFDNFVLPGIGGDDYRLLLNRLDDNTGRFIFCGIRDIKKEFTHILQNPNHETYDKMYESLRQEETVLKPLDSLAKEFADAMKIIEDNREKNDIWTEICQKSERMFPDIYQVMRDISLILLPKDQVAAFQNLSTGFKFFLHSLSRIIAYIDNDCMILFDEPENHIHPPMLSFMMASLRLVLAKYQSVMLVATHSPVVLQETFSNNVFVVRGDGNSCNISHPQIETYGASISEITTEVFDLTSDVTNFFKAYHSLYNEWKQAENWKTVDMMLDSFSRHLGGNISSQLISYLVNLFVDEHSEQEDDL